MNRHARIAALVFATCLFMVLLQIRAMGIGPGPLPDPRSHQPLPSRPIQAQSAHAAASVIQPGGSTITVTADSEAEIAGKSGIGTDGTDFLVTWNTGADIYGTRVTTTGQVLDTPPISISVSLNDEAIHPTVGFDGTDYLVVWAGARSDTAEVYAARVATDGTVLDPGGIQITTGGDPKIRMLGLAFDGTNFLVIWRDTGDRIKVARISTGGGSPQNLDAAAGTQITGGSSYYPAVAFGETHYLVVWHDSRNVAATGWDVYGARVGTDGAVLPADAGGFLICDDPEHQEHTTVGFDGTNYLVAWYDWRPDGDVLFGSAYGARVRPDGTVLDDPAFLISDRARGQHPVRVSCDSGASNCLVVWDSDHGDPVHWRQTDIYARRVYTDGTMDRRGVPVAVAFAHQFGPVVAQAGDYYLVVWRDGRVSEDWVLYGRLLERRPAATAGSSEPPHARAVDPPARAVDLSATGWVTDDSPAGLYTAAGLALSPDNAYAVGRNLHHYTGTQWTQEHAWDKTYAVWANGPDDIWAGGWCRSILRSTDGETWNHTGCHTSHSTRDVVTAIWGSGGTDLWATCDRGTVLRYEDIYHWEPITTGVSVGLWDLWGAASDDIYAVGSWGTVLHYDGADWHIHATTPTSQSLNAVWGSGPDDIFAVGDWGTIVHYDGTSWQVQESGTAEHLFDVWGTYGANVYAVGYNGTILHYDGAAWQAEISPVTDDILAVWGAARHGPLAYTVWAGGDSSTILKKESGESLFLPLVTRDH